VAPCRSQIFQKTAPRDSWAAAGKGGLKSQLIAMEHGARTIEINPEETPLSSAYQEIYRQPASRALAEIFPEIDAV